MTIRLSSKKIIFAPQNFEENLTILISVHSLAEINAATDIAFIMRSSGTTGIPKGEILRSFFFCFRYFVGLQLAVSN